MTVKDYSNRRLQNESFVNEDLRYSTFANSDLRGADFSGANLTGVDFFRVKTGITPINTVWLFTVALVISLFSGYLATLGGKTVQFMLLSKNEHMQLAGILTIILVVLFLTYAWFKGGGHAIRTVIIPVIAFALLIGITAYLLGMDTGPGMFYLALSLALIVIMLIAGTIARTAAGAVSDVLFLVVAFSGSLFGKSIGGDIAPAVMSISCAFISKRALGGARGFDLLKKVSLFITQKFGTSFRGAKMVNARFYHSRVWNADFTNADISFIDWDDSKKLNCIIDENTTK